MTAASTVETPRRMRNGTRVEPLTPPGDQAGFRQYFERTRNEPIYVILGVQGAGTNLLGRLLKKLFNFSVMRDRSMVFNAAARLGPSPSAADVEREIRAFKEAVWPSALRRKTSKNVIRKNQPLQGLAAVLQPSAIRTGADFARLIYSYRAYSMGASHIGIKSDDLWENLHLIDQVIPNRRVILLTRDFRDNLVSVGGKQFGPIEPLCAAEYVKKQVLHYAAEYRRAGASGYHLKYETLLNSTRQFIDDFSAHFGLRPAVDPEIAVPKLRFRPNKIGKWKSLPAQQLAWCEGILRDQLLEFGYPLSAASPTPPPASRMLVARARDKARRFPQKVRRMAARMRS
jgi:hypothetical protein